MKKLQLRVSLQIGLQFFGKRKTSCAIHSIFSASILSAKTSKNSSSTCESKSLLQTVSNGRQKDDPYVLGTALLRFYLGDFALDCLTAKRSQ